MVFDPTRLEFNLDMRELNRCSVLVHGITNAGKTFLLGDFLKYESGQGLPGSSSHPHQQHQ